MKDEDFEYEWRIQEISSRKTLTWVYTGLALFADLAWTLVLSEVNLTGKLIKLIIDLFIVVSVVQVYYVSSVK